MVLPFCFRNLLKSYNIQLSKGRESKKLLFERDHYRKTEADFLRITYSA